MDHDAANPGDAASRTAARIVTVDADHAGRRVDNFLAHVLGGLPRSRLYRLLRKGEVRVNGGRVGADTRLQLGDRVRIPPVRLAVAEASAPPQALLDRLRDAVLHEDDGLLVLDKPAGLAAHGGTGLAYGLIEALRALRGPGVTLELVHRLDRDTSGCIMVAKTHRRLRALHDALRAGQVEKHYLALVAGRWRPQKLRLESRLAKVRDGQAEARIEEADDGKLAVTVFDFVEDWPGATLVGADLDSGRTHQIRVQAASAGHPLAGDPTYGDPDFNARMRALGLKRMFLHAASLRIPDGSRDGLIVSAALPPDLRDVLERLGGG